MNLSKKHHVIVDQNDKKVKRSQKHDVNVQKSTTLYFQVGLILTLLATYTLFEMQFAAPSTYITDFDYDDDEPVFTTDFIAYVEPKKKIEKKRVPNTEKKIVKPIFVEKGNDVKENEPIIVEHNIANPTTTIDNPKKATPKSPLRIISVEQVPIFPGCEGLSTRQEQMTCLNSKIEKLIGRRFNSDIAIDLDVKGTNRIYVEFTIDKLGNVTKIKAQGPHEKLEKEARRVVGKIPKMIPGKQNNTNVSVIYTLPIVVRVQY